MKILNQGTTEPLMFRLESSLGNWLLVMKNGATGKEVPFIGNDISTSSDYQLFQIEEVLSGSSPLTATIELRPSGWWDIEIYDQTSSTNLDKTLVDGSLLWEEKVKVITDSLSQPESGS